jgi:hypothetical protein
VKLKVKVKVNNGKLFEERHGHGVDVSNELLLLLYRTLSPINSGLRYCMHLKLHILSLHFTESTSTLKLLHALPAAKMEPERPDISSTPSVPSTMPENSDEKPHSERGQKRKRGNDKTHERRGRPDKGKNMGRGEYLYVQFVSPNTHQTLTKQVGKLQAGDNAMKKRNPNARNGAKRSKRDH